MANDKQVEDAERKIIRHDKRREEKKTEFPVIAIDMPNGFTYIGQEDPEGEKNNARCLTDCLTLSSTYLVSRGLSSSAGHNQTPVSYSLKATQSYAAAMTSDNDGSEERKSHILEDKVDVQLGSQGSSIHRLGKIAYESVTKVPVYEEVKPEPVEKSDVSKAAVEKTPDNAEKPSVAAQ